MVLTVIAKKTMKMMRDSILMGPRPRLISFTPWVVVSSAKLYSGPHFPAGSTGRWSCTSTDGRYLFIRLAFFLVMFEMLDLQWTSIFLKLCEIKLVQATNSNSKLEHSMFIYVYNIYNNKGQ